MDRIKNSFAESAIIKEMNFRIFCVAAFGGVCFGIDYGYWSGLLGMVQFNKDFGRWSDETQSYALPSSYKSAGSALPIAGLAFGALFSGFLGNRLGRLKTFRVASILSVISVVIQAACKTNYWQLVVGRTVNSVALGALANTIPPYLAEVSPLTIRGAMINFYQFAVGVGAILCFTCNWGTQARTDQWAYRLVILLQFFMPAIFIPASFVIPESPRWLIGKGNREGAIKSLSYLHKHAEQDFIEREADLILAAEEENKTRFTNGWKDTVRGTNLRRTLIATGMQCFQQAQGSAFMSSYSIIFMQAVGVKDVYEIAVLLKLVMVASAAMCFYFPDRIGRRPILIGSALTMGICMCAVSGIKGGPLTDDDTAMKGAMACLFVWQFCNTFGWGSCVWIVTAEVSSLQVREKTITIATFSGFCVSILINFVSPFIQDPEEGNLGTGIGFIYGGVSMLCVLWCIFFLPETGFRSLEELDELFEKRVSVWKFRKYATSGFGAQQAQVEKGIAVDHKTAQLKVDEEEV